MKYYDVYGADGVYLGEYEGEKSQDAILACLQDAGYESVAEMEARLEEKCEMTAKEVKQ